jgi:hypothetical protein
MNELTTRVFCGTAETSLLSTLEGLAERGAVTQIGFQWFEPHGWSMSTSGWLGVLDGGQIKAADIIHNVSDYVHRARLRNLVGPLMAALASTANEHSAGLCCQRAVFGSDSCLSQSQRTPSCRTSLQKASIAAI